MRHVAFIRAVMVGREGLHREILLEIFRRAGAESPVSHLATGNVSFDLELDRIPALSVLVDSAITEVVGRDIEVFVRTLDDLRAVDFKAIYGGAPFEPRDRLVTYFHETPELGQPELPWFIQKGRTAVLAVDGPNVYSVAREWEGQVGAPGGILERVSGQRVTTRAWSTVQKIIDQHA